VWIVASAVALIAAVTSVPSARERIVEAIIGFLGQQLVEEWSQRPENLPIVYTR